MGPYDGSALIRFGTSSFSSEDWVGPFYPQGTKPSDFLRLYAQRYDTVEVDATYYRVPSDSTVDHWGEVTPPGFLFSLKFPKSIVHGGAEASPDSRLLLERDATYPERDRFLRVTERLGEKCGPLLLQFPYLSRKVFPSASQFEERLDRFLGDLPPGRRYSVEIRNKNWMRSEFSDLCRRHHVALVSSDHAWMPRPWELPGGPLPVASGWAYVRLIGDRKEIEAITRIWNREVLDRSPQLEQWARYLANLTSSAIPTLVYINNHYSGFAPGTAERLKQMYRDRQQHADS